MLVIFRTAFNDVWTMYRDEMKKPGEKRSNYGQPRTPLPGTPTVPMHIVRPFISLFQRYNNLITVCKRLEFKVLEIAKTQTVCGLYFAKNLQIRFT